MGDDLIGKELLGQFRIIERIGRGGMGEVFKAEQPAMERLVAIKILHAKLASRPDLVSRFRREARAMSRLSHPNTARVFLYGQLEETNQLYIVMEFLNGTDLAHHVRRNGPMDSGRGAKVMIQVLGALEEAHSVGVIHRDLKPENILLTTQGGIPDFPKVLDFGLAKVRETRPRPGSLVLTQEGMVFGTPEFMSPEQARGEILDARSDIYSLSLILYELLTGKLPFPRCKPMEYISHHIYTPPIPISERAPDLNLPPGLDPIVLKALEKDKNDRYQSAREFAEALKAMLPRTGASVAVRALPGPIAGEESKPKGESTRPVRQRAKSSLHEKNPSSGRGLVIGLVVVIVVLIAIVIWLLFTRNNTEPTVVPTSVPLLSAPTTAPPPSPSPPVR
ncbi:MAG: serine/threonine protein kinase [Deltaproteobacteria bacterium]|nr:serine/threonine protein kinase [Deltaproteobacteria bacterium]